MKSLLSRFVPAALLAVSICSGSGMRAQSADPASPASQPAAAGPGAAATDFTEIPGPLHSFERMAGISQHIPLDEVLPLMASNVELRGFEGAEGRNAKATEFLVLLRRYVQQARELEALAGADRVIRVSGCADVPRLLGILGYRFREACGPQTSLETDDPERAFLTIDSAFPLAQLEDDLRRDKPFEYPYPATQVPVMFSQKDWTSAATGHSEVLDALLNDRVLARLYWAMSRMDEETRNDLRQSPGLHDLLRWAAVMDFYGGQFCIRSGRVMVPGGAAADAGWKELAGASPEAGPKFVAHVLGKDDGWLAAYYDTLARASQEQQAYFTRPDRLVSFYKALRGRALTPNPTRPVFRPYPGLLLLATRLRLDSNGVPEIPGDVQVWGQILRRGNSRSVKDWMRHQRLENPDQLVEAMFAFSRLLESDNPLQIFLAANEIDRERSPRQRLTPQTVSLLAERYGRFGDQFSVFAEFSGLNNESIARYLAEAESLDHISDMTLRSNALGMFQANIGLWQILARQHEIPQTDLNPSWQRMLQPFARITSSTQLFDSGRASLREMERAASGESQISQNEFIELLAGPNQATDQGEQVRQELAQRIETGLMSQRLASLDVLFALGDGLSDMAQGKPADSTMIAMAEELREFELPRPLFSSGERTEWAPGLPSNPHAGLQTRTDLVKIIKSPSSPKELLEARGRLASFLRDTLVGLNYAYYDPPGGQMLRNDPLFVRSHDFSGQMTEGRRQSWQTPSLFGSGLTAGGGAYLAGSLADLPFVLASVEEDFIVPSNVQSLIWPDLAPALLTGAVLPRWWGISRNELHAVSLYQRAGEELLSSAAHDAQLRQVVYNILSDRLAPQRLDELDANLAAGHAAEALNTVLPSETFYLAAEYRKRFPGQTGAFGVAGHELEDLAAQYPSETNWERLSRDFGIPHPVMADSYAPGLLETKFLPAVMGYGSRLLAESWESNNLYWARLVDEKGYPSVLLNRLVPQLTYRMVEKISATQFEDWPALIRAMRETGEEFRQGKVAALQKGEMQ